MTAERPALVAGGHPETVSAASHALAAGGNAFDAVVAAGFAAAVAEPGLTSLGGGGFLLAHPVGQEPVVVDFFVDTPGLGRPPGTARGEPAITPVVVRFRGADQTFHAGHGSVAVPGCLAGYLHIHRRFGTLSLDELIDPARHLARHGVVVNAQQAEVLGLLASTFALSKEGKDLYLSDGRPLQVGDRCTNPALADLLDDLAAGVISGLADPVLAGPLEACMAANGGLVTGDDLRAHQVVERPPLRLEWEGSRLLTNPPPSFGGDLIARALQQLTGAPDPDTPEGAQVLAAALASIHDHHTGNGPRAVRGTTHVSIADHEGNLAAMTTSNGTCSGVFVPGTGVQLNNIMGEEDLHPEGLHAGPPGVRVGSMMSPTILEGPDGWVVLGSGGSERIRSAITTVLARILLGGQNHSRRVDLEEVIKAPRLHWDGTTLQLEPGLDAEVVAGLASQWPVRQWSERNLYFGGVHAVASTGEAAGDPRRGGTTAVIHPVHR